MNYYEAKKFVEDMHKGKKITFSFDDLCMVRVMIDMVDGCPQQKAAVFHKKVRADVEGVGTIYVPLSQTHAEMGKTGAVCECTGLKKCFVPEEEYKNIKLMESAKDQIKDVAEKEALDAFIAQTKKTLSENSNRSVEEIEIEVAKFVVDQGSVDLFAQKKSFLL